MSGIGVSRSILCVFVAIVALTAGPIYASSITALALDPQTPGTLYAGTYDRGVFKTTDAGVTWSPTGLTSGPVYALVIDPLTPTIIFAAVSNVGIFKSTDAGATWGATGLTNGVVRGLAIDLHAPTILYAVIPDSGVFKSIDGGATWDASLRIEWLFYQNPTFQALAIDPHVPTTLYVGVVYITSEIVWVSVFKSIDAGGTWCASDLNFYAESLNVLAIEPRSDPLGPATLYAGVDNYGLFRSTDDGATWSTTGLTDFYGATSIRDVVIDPYSTATVYAGLTSGWLGPTTSVLKTVDAGVSWNPADTGLADTIRTFGLRPEIAALVIDPATSTTLYAGTTIGVFKTIDGGETWTTAGLIQHSPLAGVTVDPEHVLGGDQSTGTVTLVTAPPAGGVTVALSSSNAAVAAVPSSVTLPAGSMSATFTVSTSLLSATSGTTISASFDSVTRSAALAVYAPTTVQNLWVGPSVTGGTSAMGRVVLARAPAPAGNLSVTLTSSDPAIASVPATLTVPADATFADFIVTSRPVATAASVTISATYGKTVSAVLTVTPPPLSISAVNLSFSTVLGGTPSAGMATLTATAPADGVTVVLSSNNPAIATVPSSVMVPASAKSATFTVSTAACTSGTATISAAYAGVIRTAALTVTSSSDTVAIQKAQYFAAKREIRLETTSTSSSATLSVFVTSSGALIGQLTNIGGGSYRGRFAWPVNPQNITIRSSSCGSARSDLTLG